MAPHTQSFPEVLGYRAEREPGREGLRHPPAANFGGSPEISENGSFGETRSSHNTSRREKLLKIPRDAFSSPSRAAPAMGDVAQRHWPRPHPSTQRSASPLAPETVSAFLSATRVADSVKRAAESAPVPPADVTPHDDTRVVFPAGGFPHGHDSTVSQASHVAMRTTNLSLSSEIGSRPRLLGTPLQAQGEPRSPPLAPRHLPAQPPAYQQAQMVNHRSLSRSQGEGMLASPAEALTSAGPHVPTAQVSGAGGSGLWSQSSVEGATLGGAAGHYQEGPHHGVFRDRHAPANSTSSTFLGSPSQSSEGASAGDTMATSPCHTPTHRSRGSAAVTSPDSWVTSASPGQGGANGAMTFEQQQHTLHPLFVESLSGFDEPRPDMLADFCTMLTLAIRSMAHPLETFCADVGQHRGSAFAPGATSAGPTSSPAAELKSQGMKRKLSTDPSVEDGGRDTVVRSRTSNALQMMSADTASAQPCGSADISNGQTGFSTGFAEPGPVPAAAMTVGTDECGPGQASHGISYSHNMRGNESAGDLATHIEDFSMDTFEDLFLTPADLDAPADGAGMGSADVAPGIPDVAPGSASVAKSVGVGTWEPEDLTIPEMDGRDPVSAGQEDFFLDALSEADNWGPEKRGGGM